MLTRIFVHAVLVLGKVCILQGRNMCHTPNQGNNCAEKMDVTVICRGINESLYMGCLRMFKTCFLYSRGTSEDLELFTMSCFTIKKYVL